MNHEILSKKLQPLKAFKKKTFLTYLKQICQKLKFGQKKSAGKRLDFMQSARQKGKLFAAC